MATTDLFLPQSAPLTAPSKEGALMDPSLPLLREAKRPSGVEWNAGGIPDREVTEPQRDGDRRSGGGRNNRRK